jgi:hypothetical protein
LFRPLNTVVPLFGTVEVLVDFQGDEAPNGVVHDLDDGPGHPGRVDEVRVPFNVTNDPEPITYLRKRSVVCHNSSVWILAQVHFRQFVDFLESVLEVFLHCLSVTFASITTDVQVFASRRVEILQIFEAHHLGVSDTNPEQFEVFLFLFIHTDTFYHMTIPLYTTFYYVLATICNESFTWVVTRVTLKLSLG